MSLRSIETNALRPFAVSLPLSVFLTLAAMNVTAWCFGFEHGTLDENFFNTIMTGLNFPGYVLLAIIERVANPTYYQPYRTSSMILLVGGTIGWTIGSLILGLMLDEYARSAAKSVRSN